MKKCVDYFGQNAIWDQRVKQDNLISRNELWQPRPFVDIGQSLSSTCNARINRPQNWMVSNSTYFKPLNLKDPYRRVDPFKNIPIESHLYNLDYYNPKDLIIDKNGKCLMPDNRLSDLKLYKELQPLNLNTFKVWDQNTGIKNTDKVPIC